MALQTLEGGFLSTVLEFDACDLNGLSASVDYTIMKKRVLYPRGGGGSEPHQR